MARLCIHTQIVVSLLNTLFEEKQATKKKKKEKKKEKKRKMVVGGITHLRIRMQVFGRQIYQKSEGVTSDGTAVLNKTKSAM